MNTANFINELQSLIRRLEYAEREDTDWRRRAELLADVHDVLHGTCNVNSIPSNQRWKSLDRCMPEVEAWCVLKWEAAAVRPGGSTQRERKSIWPGQAYASVVTAERWREFLEDYYRDTSQRDGKKAWVVEFTMCDVAEFNRGRRRRHVGDGYTRDRMGWVGTLPMENFHWVEGRGWVRNRRTVDSTK